jgi:FkbM family methyltransferase
MLALHEVLSSDAVCIDGGANIGVLTLALALYAPRGRVIAFEPSQRCLPYLRYNLELNTVVNAHVEPLGLWSHPGTLMLNGDPRHPGGAYVGKADPTTVPEQIHVTSIDSWANEAGLTRLDLLKLDIEGAELQALEGASRTIASLRPSVLCEVNASALRQFHARDWTDLYRRLRSEYRWLFFVRENGGAYWLFGQWHLRRLLWRRGVVNVLCRPSRPKLFGRGSKAARRRLAASIVQVVRLLADFTPFRPPSSAFIHDTVFRVDYGRLPVGVPSGSAFEAEVSIVNMGKSWWSSDFDPHPVVLGYRWYSEDGKRTLEGVAGRFARPVGPRRKTTVRSTIQTPPIPGRYELRVMPVQDRYAWGEDILREAFSGANLLVGSQP